MGSNILITLNNYDLPNIKIVKTFKNIEWEDVDCLVFHSSSDSEIEIVKELSHIKGLVPKVIYINKNINPLYYCIFTGLDADIYDSEDYLLDATVLNFLIESYKETEMTIKSPDESVETLAKCIATISTSSVESLQKLISNDFWMKTLNTAVSNVDNAISRASQININIVDMLGETSKLIEGLKTSNEFTSRELEKAMKLVADMERKAKPNTPFIFSTYSVPVTVPKVLYVKAYGNCRYLNSFFLAYQHYLRMSKQYSSKVLIALPKLKIYTQRYRDAGTRLAHDSLEMVDFKSSNVFVTFEPKKAVMDAFFNQSNVQIYIVIDLMFGDTLVEGHMVDTFYAVSGLSDMKRFNLKPERCLMPITALSSNILIPHINRYANANDSTKRSLYFEQCAKSFKKIDDIIIKQDR